MRYGIGPWLLAVILSISPGVVAQGQEETPSPRGRSRRRQDRRKGDPTAPGKSKFERPGRRFGGDQGMPPDMVDFPMEDYDEGPIDEPHPDAAQVPPAPVPDSTMDYLAAIGTLALAFAVVTAAAVMRVRRVLSADAAFKLIALSLIVVAGLPAPVQICPGADGPDDGRARHGPRLHLRQADGEHRAGRRPAQVVAGRHPAGLSRTAYAPPEVAVRPRRRLVRTPRAW